MPRKKAVAVSGSPEGARRASAGEPAARGEGGRFTARRKREAVLKVLRGETLDAVSRSLGVTAGTLAGWRDHFLAGGESSLKILVYVESYEGVSLFRGLPPPAWRCAGWSTHLPA